MGPIRPRKELKTMKNVLHIGGEIVNEACLVLCAAMDDESYKPAVVLTISLDGGAATIDTLGFHVNGPDSVKVADLDTIELFDIILFRDRGGYYSKYLSDSCALQAHAIDVSKADWSAAVNVYEWAGLTDWRDPKHKRLRDWKHAWWRIVLDTFDLDIDD